MKMILLLLLTIGNSEATTCYNKTTTSKPYDILKSATVETQRGCEVECNANEKCAGFSFKDVGFSSECILLSRMFRNEICALPAVVYLKISTGCVARTNLTAEFGVDPCIDEMVPIQQTLGAKKICPQNKANLFVVRAIDANGRRITLDNDIVNYLEISGDMWAYRYIWGTSNVRIPIVAAVCAFAGGVKCPCKAIEHLKVPKVAPTRPAQPNILSPCATGARLYWNLAKSTTAISYLNPPDARVANVTCKAGMWIVWRENDKNSFGTTALACY